MFPYTEKYTELQNAPTTSKYFRFFGKLWKLDIFQKMFCYIYKFHNSYFVLFWLFIIFVNFWFFVYFVYCGPHSLTSSKNSFKTRSYSPGTSTMRTRGKHAVCGAHKWSKRFMEGRVTKDSRWQYNFGLDAVTQSRVQTKLPDNRCLN